jgi:hypothetical protein
MSYDKVRKQLEKDIEKKHQDRLARCIPVAKKIVALIGENVESLEMGDSFDMSETYDPLTKKILELLLAENVYWVDRDFVMQLVLQPFSGLQRLVKASLDQAQDIMYTGALGKSVYELRAQDVDNFLRLGDKIIDDSAILESTASDSLSKEEPKAE